MAKKGKALGRDPLFWVRNTQKEKPTTSEKGLPDDTPTVSLPSPEAEKAAGTPKPKGAEVPPAAPAKAASRPDVKPGQPAAQVPPRAGGGPKAAVPTSTPSVPPPPAVDRTAPGVPASRGLPLSPRELQEPRGMFLAVVLAVMLVLLLIGCIAYLQLSARLGRLEDRIQRIESPTERVIERRTN